MISTTMGGLILEMPAQLMWARDVDPPHISPAHHVVLLAMGGSAMAARAAAATAAASRAVVHVHQGYGLPSWAAAHGALVVAVSYSGNTAEVLSGVRAAVEANLPLVAVSSGGTLADIASASPAPHLLVPAGLPPRAALGFQIGAVLRALEGAGIVEDSMGALSEAADVVGDLLGDGNGAACALGADIAKALESQVPMIVGATGPGALAAGRWTTQVEENAKRMAISLEVPEANHNALESWAAGVDHPGRFGLVTLFDPPGDRRNQERLQLMSRYLGASVVPAGEARSQGRGPLARLLSLAIVGDVASVVMAEDKGVDQMAVDALENFKRALREE
jgi:glucose/mannose-6-phosphate isomerase